jgi:hypothetical protein
MLVARTFLVWVRPRWRLITLWEWGPLWQGQLEAVSADELAWDLKHFPPEPVHRAIPRWARQVELHMQALDLTDAVRRDSGLYELPGGRVLTL